MTLEDKIRVANRNETGPVIKNLDSIYLGIINALNFSEVLKLKPEILKHVVEFVETSFQILVSDNNLNNSQALSEFPVTVFNYINKLIEEDGKNFPLGLEFKTEALLNRSYNMLVDEIQKRMNFINKKADSLPISKATSFIEYNANNFVRLIKILEKCINKLVNISGMPEEVYTFIIQSIDIFVKKLGDEYVNISQEHESMMKEIVAVFYKYEYYKDENRKYIDKIIISLNDFYSMLISTKKMTSH